MVESGGSGRSDAASSPGAFQPALLHSLGLPHFGDKAQDLLPAPDETRPEELNRPESLILLHFQSGVDIPPPVVRQLPRQLLDHILRHGIEKPPDYWRALLEQQVGGASPVDGHNAVTADHLGEMMGAPCATPDQRDRVLVLLEELVRLAGDRQAGLHEHVGGGCQCCAS